MSVRIMYCPGCERKLEIKENTSLDGMKCPLCHEAYLLPAESAINNSAGCSEEFFRKVDYRNRAVANHPRIWGMRFYWNRENFHLGERKN
jgi:hypothetical protein